METSTNRSGKIQRKINYITNKEPQQISTTRQEDNPNNNNSQKFNYHSKIDIGSPKKDQKSRFQQKQNNRIINSPIIQKIIYDRKPRFQSKIRRDKNHLMTYQSQHIQHSTSRSNHKQEFQDFQIERQKKKQEIMERLNKLNNKLKVPNEANNILISDEEQSQREYVKSSNRKEYKKEQNIKSDDRRKQVTKKQLNFPEFKRFLSELKQHHQTEINNLNKYNSLKLKSLEKVIQNKDKIIKQLQIQSKHQKQYIEKLQRIIKDKQI